MEMSKELLVASSFLLGMLAAGLFFMSGVGLSGYVISEPTKSLESIPSVPNILEETDFQIYQDRVLLYLDNATIVSYTDTDSMWPIISNSSHGIRIKPKSQFDIKEGDIVSFSFSNITIVHRVVEVGSDTQGMYFITQGDNSLERDTRRLRFSEIDWKLVGIIY